MKTRTILGALIMTAVIGSSVGVGYAGGGGAGGFGGVFLWQCYGVEQGTQPPPANAALSIDDQFTNATKEQVGKLKLLCTLTDWHLENAQLRLVQNADHITCYEVSQAQATPSVVTLKDAISGESGQTVTVQGMSKYVCVLATCESGDRST